MDSTPFDRFAQALGRAPGRRAALRALAGAALAGLLGRAVGVPPAAAADVTHLTVSNDTGAPVEVWLTLGRDAGCVALADIPFVTTRVNDVQGSFTLAPHDSVTYTAPAGACLSGNVTFGAPPQNCPDRARWPEGINLAEFTLNNGAQGAGAQETVDISAVYGANAHIRFELSGGGAWNAGSGRPNVTQFENAGLLHNVGEVGVFPYGCDDCTRRTAPTVTCPGPSVPPFPDTCDAAHICNVQRDAARAGGTVHIVLGGFL